MTTSKMVTPAVKARPPNAGKGRVKGVQNKTTKAMKTMVLEAANAMGGAEGLVRFAKKNDGNARVFWQVAARLIPTEIGGTGEPVRIIVETLGPES